MVARPDGTAIYPAGTGLTLAIGDIVGTLDRTRAIVTFFSGSEIELGSNTTIVIRRLDRDLLDSANVTVEHLSGMTVIRVNSGQPVRVLAGDTIALIRTGEAGHGVDPNTNNIAVVCVDGATRCTPNGVAFPTELASLPGALTLPGGGQFTTTVHNLNRTSGTLRINWDAFGVSDRFQIFYQGVQVSDSGFVSNTGSANVPFGPGISTFVQVTVSGSTPLSQWEYSLDCLP